MKPKICLRCGGICASYATQCIHCNQGFNQPYVEDKNQNKKIILLLTEFRQGKPIEEIAASLNADEVKRWDAECPWDTQSVAYFIHRFISEGINQERQPSVVFCPHCRAPLLDSSCTSCKDKVTTAKPKQQTPIGLIALIFNGLVIGGLSLFIFYCTNYVTDGVGFNSNFVGLFLIIGATILAGIVFLIGNIALITMAISSSPKRSENHPP